MRLAKLRGVLCLILAEREGKKTCASKARLNERLRSSGWMTVLAICTCWGACGRSPIPFVPPNAEEAGVQGNSTAQADAKISNGDALKETKDSNQKEPICQPSCNEICMHLIKCFSEGQNGATCTKECEEHTAASTSCIAKLICEKKASCDMLRTCLPQAPLPDLTIADFKATIQNATVIYSLKVCNLGQVKAPASRFDLYFDRFTAPKVKDSGDRVEQVPVLDAGKCYSMTLKRDKTPVGQVASWAQVDGQAEIDEEDEDNNVAGPLTVAVVAPPQPDLIVKDFQVKHSGADLNYEAEICNQGKAAAYFFRVDVYYKRPLPPVAMAIGDVSSNILLLSAGQCKTIHKTYTDAPIGVYSSWVMVDTLNNVVEENEKNNTAGPKVFSVSAPLDCLSLCAEAVRCGLFDFSEGTQCLSWCNSLDATEKQCAEKAAKAKNCGDLKACHLPAKPLPPPPPWACYSICDYLTKTCKFLPVEQLLSCVAGCVTLPDTKKQCALEAMNKKQCFALSLCLMK